MGFFDRPAKGFDVGKPHEGFPKSDPGREGALWPIPDNARLA
jgi:hypothetical protein